MPFLSASCAFLWDAESGFMESLLTFGFLKDSLPGGAGSAEEGPLRLPLTAGDFFGGIFEEMVHVE
jgi:hypothetical protein